MLVEDSKPYRNKRSLPAVPQNYDLSWTLVQAAELQEEVVTVEWAKAEKAADQTKSTCEMPLGDSEK